MVHMWGRNVEGVGIGALSYGASLAGNKRGRLIRRGSRGARVGKGLQQASRGSSDGIAAPASERRQAVRGECSAASGERSARWWERCERGGFREKQASRGSKRAAHLRCVDGAHDGRANLATEDMDDQELARPANATFVRRSPHRRGVTAA